MANAFRMLAINTAKKLALASIYSAAAIAQRRSSTGTPTWFPFINNSSNYFEKNTFEVCGSKLACRILEDARKNPLKLARLSLRDCNSLTAEVLHVYNSGNESSLEIEEDSAIAVSGDACKIKSSCITDGMTSDDLTLDTKDRFQWINVREGSRLTVKSDRAHTVSTPILKYQNKKTSKDLVIVLFIDGLADIERLGLARFLDVMPNTCNFFEKGYRASKHYANADWTLASVPSLFTGLYSTGHGLFHPSKNHTLNQSAKLISEEFSAAGYHTYNIGGNWRVSPLYGYSRGFDRTIYKHSMTSKEVVGHVIDASEALSSRSQFCWATFLDLHHDLNLIPDLGMVMTGDGYDHQNNGPKDSALKSIFAAQNPVKTQNYLARLSSIDRHLGALYNHFERESISKDITVAIVSDHGQSYLGSECHPLSIARMSVPFFIRSSTLGGANPFQGFTQNVDVPGIILADSGIWSEIIHNSKGMLPKQMGGIDRTAAISISTYPGQTFKARKFSDDDVLDIESTEAISSPEDLYHLSCTDLKIKSHNNVDIEQSHIEEIMKHLLS